MNPVFEIAKHCEQGRLGYACYSYDINSASIDKNMILSTTKLFWCFLQVDCIPAIIKNMQKTAAGG